MKPYIFLLFTIIGICILHGYYDGSIASFYFSTLQTIVIVVMLASLPYVAISIILRDDMEDLVSWLHIAIHGVFMLVSFALLIGSTKIPYSLLFGFYYGISGILSAMYFGVKQFVHKNIREPINTDEMTASN